MAFQNLSVIDFVTAKRNGLPFFDLLLKEWGDADQAAALAFTLPNDCSLSGLMIAPNSTVEAVGVQASTQDFLTVQPSTPNVDNVIETGDFASGAPSPADGFMFASGFYCSNNAPLFEYMPGPVTIYARAKTRYRATAATGGGYIQDGTGTRVNISFGDTTDPRPILALRCFINDVGPIGLVPGRQPLIGGRVLLASDYINASPSKSTLALIRIGGRKRGYAEVSAQPNPRNGSSGGAINVRMSLLRGGLCRTKGVSLPWTTLWEEQVTAGAPPSFVTITNGGATNGVRKVWDNVQAEWLLIEANRPGAGTDVAADVSYCFED